MKNELLEEISKKSSEKVTENGQFALDSTGSPLLNAFGTLGSMRERTDNDVLRTFIDAYGENPKLAMKLLFYVRDIREGLGERNIFRIIAKYLADNHKDEMKKNLRIIPEYGRWDDLYCFVGTALERDAFDIIKKQFGNDIANMEAKKSVSLMAKWLKSVNTSSAESRRLGRLTAKALGLSEKGYRKSLSLLRKAIDVVEKKMTEKEWSQIKYEAVPSYATKNYKNAFREHDEERYNSYITDVKNGTAEIKSGVLYPYDLIEALESGKDTDVTELQWKALPDYVASDKKFLVMADVSGSMEGRPMDVAVGLAIYFAERCSGSYHGKALTFTEKPRFFSLSDDLSLNDKVHLVKDKVGYNTDLKAAFELLLESAIKIRAKQSDLPTAILVISDMEIDSACENTKPLLFTDEMKKRFNDAGYELPILVYWNVNARNDTFHADKTNPYARFLSGSAATTFKSLCDNIGSDATELMLKVLNSERYDAVK